MHSLRGLCLQLAVCVLPLCSGVLISRFAFRRWGWITRSFHLRDEYKEVEIHGSESFNKRILQCSVQQMNGEEEWSESIKQMNGEEE